jgi:hypothetical protein
MDLQIRRVNELLSNTERRVRIVCASLRTNCSEEIQIAMVSEYTAVRIRWKQKDTLITPTATESNVQVYACLSSEGSRGSPLHSQQHCPEARSSDCTVYITHRKESLPQIFGLPTARMNRIKASNLPNSGQAILATGHSTAQFAVFSP